MSSAFKNKVVKLRALITRFDAASNESKLTTLQELSKCELPGSRSLIDYADLLQFLQAFPPDRKTLKAAEKELSRLVRFVIRPGDRSNKSLINSGLPYTPYQETGASSFGYYLWWAFCVLQVCL